MESNELAQSIKSFLPLIGVIVGFLLATVKEWIQNKPKVKMNLKRGLLNYYHIGTDGDGFPIEKIVLPSESNCLKISVDVDIFNSGKAPTAIQSVDVLVKRRKENGLYYSPKMTIGTEEIYHHSFNLVSSSIVTMSLNLTIDKPEEFEKTSVFFENNALDFEDKNRLILVIILKDIFNKNHKLLVEPVSIHGAF